MANMLKKPMKKFKWIKLKRFVFLADGAILIITGIYFFIPYPTELCGYLIVGYVVLVGLFFLKKGLFDTDKEIMESWEAEPVSEDAEQKPKEHPIVNKTNTDSLIQPNAAASQNILKEEEPLHEEEEDPYSIGDYIVERSEISHFLGKKLCTGFLYECHDYETIQRNGLKTRKDKYLSLKVIADNFKKEALAWIELEKHPYILNVSFVRGIYNGLRIFSKTVLPDENGKYLLEHYLKEPIPLKQALIWSIQFCYGMEYAYSKGAGAHGDIRPDNIMIAEGKILKIVAFSFARLWKGSNISDSGIIVNKIIAVNPAYMAPEQFEDKEDTRSDIYAFGIVMYQMINNGRPPFYLRGGDSWEKAHKSYQILPQKAEGGDASGIFIIIERCLRKNPDERYSSFEELRHALEVFYTEAIGETPSLQPDIDSLKVWELYDKGSSLHHLGCLDEAIKIYREVIKVAPKADYTIIYLVGPDPEGYRPPVREAVLSAYYGLGLALYEKGDFDEAIKALKESVRINPVNAFAHYYLGKALIHKGQIDEAIIAFNNFIISAASEDAEYAEYIEKARDFINLHKKEKKER